MCCPPDLEARTVASYLKNGGWAMAVLAAGWVLANVVPFFSQFLGLIGGALAGPINFLLPVLVYLVAAGHQIAFETRQVSAERVPTLSGGTSSAAESPDAETAAPEKPQPANSIGQQIATALRSLSTWEVVFIFAIAIFIVFTMIFGVFDQILQVIELQHETGASFTCHALDVEENPISIGSNLTMNSTIGAEINAMAGNAIRQR